MSTEVVISAPKPCDFCNQQGSAKDATVDGKTTMGPWANMCDDHFAKFGVGLGTGLGQRLIVKGSES